MLVYKISCFLSMFFLPLLAQYKPYKGLLVSYTNIAPHKILNYDTVILESSFYELTDILQIKKSNKKVYAYLSVSEVNINDFEKFDRLKSYVLDYHKNWDSAYLNLGAKEVQLYLEETVQKIFAKGFDGVFLDTLDNVVQIPKYQWMKPKVVELINKIHQNYPHKAIIQNGGVELLNQTHKKINGILMESIYTDYDFTLKKYRFRDDFNANLRAQTFKKILSKYKLKGFLIEYATNTEMIKQLHSMIGFKKVLYTITDINLQFNE